MHELGNPSLHLVRTNLHYGNVSAGIRPSHTMPTLPSTAYYAVLRTPPDACTLYVLLPAWSVVGWGCGWRSGIGDWGNTRWSNPESGRLYREFTTVRALLRSPSTNRTVIPRVAGDSLPGSGKREGQNAGSWPEITLSTGDSTQVQCWFLVPSLLADHIPASFVEPGQGCVFTATSRCSLAARLVAQSHEAPPRLSTPHSPSHPCRGSFSCHFPEMHAGCRRWHARQVLPRNRERAVYYIINALQCRLPARLDERGREKRR